MARQVRLAGILKERFANDRDREEMREFRRLLKKFKMVESGEAPPTDGILERLARVWWPDVDVEVLRRRARDIVDEAAGDDA